MWAPRGKPWRWSRFPRWGMWGGRGIRAPRRGGSKPTATTGARPATQTESRRRDPAATRELTYCIEEVVGKCPRSWSREHHGWWNTDGSHENMKYKTSRAKPESVSYWCPPITCHWSPKWRDKSKKCTQIAILGLTVKTQQWLRI